MISPKGTRAPRYMFNATESDDNKEVITRTINLSRLDESKQVILLASKVLYIDGKEFVRCYQFNICEKEGLAGTFTDEYVYIRTVDGTVSCLEISELIDVEEIKTLIVCKGWQDTERMYNSMLSVKANELYHKAYYYFMTKAYAEITSDSKVSIFYNSCPEIEFVQLYARGVRDFITSKTVGIVNNTQRLLDEVKVLIEVYKVQESERYFKNCQLFLEQCPEDSILDNAYVLWDDGADDDFVAFDFLWDTEHLDCRYSVELDNTTWHVWVGVNHHSNDDETYINGIGGEAIYEDYPFAEMFFDEMKYQIIDCGRV